MTRLHISRDRKGRESKAKFMSNLTDVHVLRLILYVDVEMNSTYAENPHYQNCVIYSMQASHLAVVVRQDRGEGRK